MSEEENQEGTEEAQTEGDAAAEGDGAEAAQLESFDSDAVINQATEQYPSLEKVLDLPVEMTVRIGQTEISIRRLLQLNQGSVIELDRHAGDSMDILVNGVLIAHGEVVVVNDKFGIRLTDVISPQERINKLK